MSAFLAILAAVFIPSTHVDGDRTVLPVRFTDGTRAELRYPPALRLAELGVEPYGSGTLGVARDFVIRHETVADAMADFDGTLLRTYPSGATYWDTPRRVGPRYLAFQFGRWAVLVYDYRGGAAAMTRAQRAAWARSLRGRETGRGFLRLWGRGRLRLSEAGGRRVAAAGGATGPQLTFGSVGGPRWLALVPGPCERTHHGDRRVGGKWVNWDGRFATWCAAGEMRVHARGRRPFVRALIRGLEVR